MVEPTPRQNGAGAETPSAKERVRRGVTAAVAGMTAGVREKQSAWACARLEAMPGLAKLVTALVYAPDGWEVDVRPLALRWLAAGVRVCVPRVDWRTKVMQAALVLDWSRDLVAGKHGIMQPAPHCPEVSPEELDVILVPGVAFDSTCARLGRGAGFYDRFLADPRVRAAKIGVAFDEQIVDAVPMERWDVRLDAVVTPTRVIERG